MATNTITVSRSVRAAGQTVGGTGQTLTAPVVKSWKKENVTPGTTVATLAGQFDIDVSQIVAIAVEANQNGTIKTNTFATPDDTIPLVKNVPYTWVTGDDAALLFTTDVTQVHFTNDADPGDNDATITLIVALNI